MRDPYAVLGVSPGCSDDELKTAYRQLTKQYHPDLHPDDAGAAAKMSEINAAYDQIKNGAAAAEHPGSASAYQGAYSPYGQAGQEDDFDPFEVFRRYQEQAYRQQAYQYRQQQQQTPPRQTTYYRQARPGIFLRILFFFLILRFITSLLFGGFLGLGSDTSPREAAAPYSYYTYRYPAGSGQAPENPASGADAGSEYF